MQSAGLSAQEDELVRDEHRTVRVVDDDAGRGSRRVDGFLGREVARLRHVLNHGGDEMPVVRGKRRAGLAGRAAEGRGLDHDNAGVAGMMLWALGTLLSVA